MFREVTVCSLWHVLGFTYSKLASDLILFPVPRITYSEFENINSH